MPANLTPEELNKYESALKNITKLTNQVIDLNASNENILSDVVSNAAELNDQAQEYLGHLKKEDDVSKEVLDTMKSQVDALKDNVKLGMKKQKQQDIEQAALDDVNEKWDMMSAKIKGYIAKFKSFFSGWKGFAVGIGLVAVALFKVYKDVVSAQTELRQSLGVTGGTFRQIQESATDINVKWAKLGVGIKESYEITKGIVSEFGSVDYLTGSMRNNVAAMTVALGMSADEAAKTMSSFMNILGGSEGAANNMLKMAAMTAKANDVPMGKTIRDIADNAESVAKYTRGTGENIVDATVAANKLGLSISNITSIADNLLNFESSIEAEMNAMVLTGKSMNLERARSLALSGKLAELQVEIVKNLASESEWGEMNMIQRKAMADALGIGVAEMGKMISRQGALDKLVKGTMTPMKAMAEGATLSDILDAEGIIDPLRKLMNSLIRVTSIVVKVLTPAFETLSGLISILTFDFDNIKWADFLKYLLLTLVGLTAIWGIGRLIKLLDFGSIFNFGGKGAVAGAAGKKGIFSRIFGNMSWGDVAKGLVIMVGLAAALWVLGKALQEFNKVDWAALGKAGVALVGMGFAMKIFGKIFTPELLTSIGVVAAFSAAIWILGSALQQFTEVSWEDMAKAGVALIGIGIAMLALGAIFTGPQLLLILIAIGVIAAFSAALWLFGKALQAIKSGLDGFADKITAIGAVGSDLVVAAGAIYMLGGALAFLSASLAAGSVLDFFGLGGTGMIDKLIELADNADKLQVAASAVQTIATGGAGGGIAPAAAAVTGAGTNVIITPTGEKATLADVVEKLDDIMDQFEEGVDLKLNGAVVGQWLAKTQRKS